MPPTSLRELARRLGEAGLSRRRKARPPTDPGAALARILGAAGPVTAAFAHFLAHAPERLPAVDRAPLAAVPLDLSPLPPSSVRSLLERHMGTPLENHFASFEDTPTTVTFLHQDHRARRADGAPVQVRVARSGAVDAEALAALAVVEDLRVEGWWLAGAATEFADGLATQADLSPSASALHQLAQHTAGQAVERPRAATVVGELSTAEILTLAVPPSVAWEAVDAASDAPFRLYRGWLLLAVVEGLLWTGPWPGNVRFLAGDEEGELEGDTDRNGGGVLRAGCPLFLGGGALALDREARWDLRDYLAATRRGEADRALRFLLRGGHRAPGALPSRTLRDHFRQAVPPVTGTGRTLASVLLLHAHLLGSHGYRPAPAMQAWQRSLAALETFLGPATLDVDPLAAAVDDARILGAAARGRELFAPSALRRSFIRFGPQWLDALERRGETADEAPPVAPPIPTPRTPRAAESWVGFGVLVVLLALVALLGERLGEQLAGLHPVFTPAMTVLFAALALFTLWFVTRMS